MYKFTSLLLLIRSTSVEIQKSLASLQIRFNNSKETWQSSFSVGKQNEVERFIFFQVDNVLLLLFYGVITMYGALSHFIVPI